jgi:hypothetical protein
MPCDYASRHALPIEDLTKEKERLMVDMGEEIEVMRVLMADLPPALSRGVLKEVVEQDEVYKKLKEAQGPRHGPLHGGLGGARGGVQGGEDSHT